jgi:uncharacterized repeat protein (TIGR01451 family)
MRLLCDWSSDVCSSDLFEQKNLWANLLLPGFQNIGDTLTFITRLSSIQSGDTIYRYDTLRSVLTCSYDPNDKILIPLNTLLNGDKLYAFDDYIEYQVRFQNTGNDTAQKVVIKDQLPAQFDVNSVQVISASHELNYSMDAGGLMVFTLNNIQLPDSGINFLGSMGYVKFSARLKTGIARNAAINNNARIYFDQNAPVFTNIATFYRVECRNFVNPHYSSTSLCAGEDYFVTLNDHGLHATYQWTMNGSSFATGDSVQWHIPSTGTYLVNIHINLPVCSFDSLKSITVSLTPPVVTLNAPADTTICPATQLTLQSNYPVNWYLNNVLNGTGYNNFCLAGDTVVVTYFSGGCTGRAQTIVHPLFAYHFPLLTDSVIALHTYYNGCEMTNLNLSSYSPNTAWTWNFNNFTSAIHDTASSVSIYFDTLSNNGYVSLAFDSLGCFYNESYNLNVIHNVSTHVIIDTTGNLLCPGSSASIVLATTMDSAQCFLGSNYDTTFHAIFTGLQLYTPGNYTANCYINGCPYSPVHFNINLSTAAYPYITESGGLLITSSGLYENWYYSSDTAIYSFNYVTFVDTLLSPAIGYYQLLGRNSDNCLGNSPVYYFNPLGFLSGAGNRFNAWFDEKNRCIYTSGLKSMEHPEIQIYNQQGQLIWKTITSGICHLPEFADGIYTAKIICEKELRVLKILSAVH